MRTIGFRSNVLFAIAAAFGVIAALGKPWYGPELPSSDARMEDLFGGIGRAVSEPGGTAGWAALHTTDQVIAGLAVTTAVLVALTLVPALQRQLQPLARWSALATVGVVLLTLLDGPGTTAMAEPRHGMLLALASALVLLASTCTVAAAPARRRVATKTYTPPPPAPVYDADHWGPPQF
jgi:heme A synthase